jgi:hypothetical protein
MRPAKTAERPTQIEPAEAGDLSGRVSYQGPTGDEAAARADRGARDAGRDALVRCDRCGAGASARVVGITVSTTTLPKIVESDLPHAGRGGRLHRFCGGRLEIYDITGSV